MEPLSGRALRPTHRWTLNDPAVIGYPQIGEHNALVVFAIALSMQNQLFLHSPAILREISVLSASPSPLVPTPGIGMSGYVVKIDEELFVAMAIRLKNSWALPGKRGVALRAALAAYWDALHSIRVRSRYLNVYAAFELAVNHLQEKTSDRFDRKAGNLTRRSPAVIKNLRELNNSLKHSKAAATYGQRTAYIGLQSRNLKGLLDRSLAKRLGFRLPVTYGQWVPKTG